MALPRACLPERLVRRAGRPCPAPQALLTRRACRWAIGQIHREQASVNGVRRQLGTGWRTVWEAVKPLLQDAAENESRFVGVTTLGVDEHVWHHVSTRPIEDGGRGPKELTGMVDLIRHGRQTRQPGGPGTAAGPYPCRSGQAYKTWLTARGTEFRGAVQVARLDPFHGYKNAIDDQLDDARAVLDAFHVVKLATQAVDDVRRRVQQDTTGHRGRRGDPLYRSRNILRAGREHLTDRQLARLHALFTARAEHVEVAWRCAQQVRSAYHQDIHAAGRAVAENILTTFAGCPIPEVARLGRTLRQWRSEFLGYFDTGGANNGGTEAINGLIELHRRIARGFLNRENYRLRMLLIGGGLDHSPHTQR